jgi:hypothetical protein
MNMTVPTYCIDHLIESRNPIDLLRCIINLRFWPSRYREAYTLATAKHTATIRS